MGEQRVRRQAGVVTEEFTEALLADLDALERMIAEGRIESGVRRIGAEQEVFLVNRSWRPAPVAMDVLDALDDPAFTTELGRFNLEINLEPMAFGGDCLSRLERTIDDKLGQLRQAAAGVGADACLAGILPTVRASDLGRDNMTPRDRYLALDEALRRQGGGTYEVRLRGTDELVLEHDSVMLEACCTSFQIHFQVGPEEFASLYNQAQLIIAPVLAAATNAPLLFGRRLWKETRIPLFQQSIDTRDGRFGLRELRPRVRFGHDWVDASVLELFRQDIARFRFLVSVEPDQDPFELLDQGVAPPLQVLQVHNGCVYRWNRPCYGVLDGKPHLRIEMRALPAGPSVVDEVANAALFYGLMRGLGDELGDVRRLISFGTVRSNFFAAAKLGLEAQLAWLDGRFVPAGELVRRELLPVARVGLERAGIAAADVDRYLGVIDERVARARTGAHWLLGSARRLGERGSREEVLSALTAATVARQQEGKPAHEWTWAELEEGIAMRPMELRVEEFMSTDLFTVDPDEPLRLVARLMEWRHVRHIPVEEKGLLVGLLSCFDVMHHFGRRDGDESVTVRHVMRSDPVTVGPDTTVLDALSVLRRERVSCLPVVDKGRLVGIVSEHDFIHVVQRILEQTEAGPAS